VPFSYQNSQTYSSSSSAGPPVEGELIYTGNLSNAVFGVKLFSYGSSLFNLCVVPAICLKTGFEFGNVALQLAGFSVLCVFTFITPVLLHLFSKRYVVRLYHNADTDTYTAVTYNVLLLEKKTVFHQKDVKIPDVSKMFTTFYANRKAMIVNPMLFTVQNDYHHLMGYDQPYSFDMEDN
ncbi:TMM70 protein, partial [Amia calva]|nr:TMM70 protein [Amia calva]